MSSSPAPSVMTTRERLQLLEQLDLRETKQRGRAVLLAWASVGFATLVLVFLVFGAWWVVRDAQDELRTVARDYSATTARLREATAAVADVTQTLAIRQAELTEATAKFAFLTQALGSVPQPQRSAAIESQLAADPKGASLLPRAYVQIVDAEDRTWAETMSRRLEKQGIVVPGVEYVPKAVGLKATDVRYYKEAERDGADRIVKLLKAEGVDASSTYLRQEQNTKVRPNHFEIWFAKGSRNTQSPKTGGE